MQQEPNEPVAKTETELLSESLTKVCLVAQTDTSGGRCCGKLILAWLDAKKYGGWDPTDLWVLDDELKGHVIRALTVLGQANGHYPDRFIPNGIKNVIRIWGRRK